MSELRSFAKETSPGVFHCHEWGLNLDSQVVDLLVSEARVNLRSRARLCMHPGIEDTEQQMLIVMVEGAVDAPHKHPDKRETLVPILGTAEYQIFDQRGIMQNRILMGQQDTLYMSSPIGVFHRVVLLEPVFAFWEFSAGPFTESSSVRSEWSDPLYSGFSK